MIAATPEKLTEFVLGTLPPEEMAELEALCAQDPALASQADELRALLSDYASVLPPTPLAPEGRARLMAAVASPDRFAPFLAKLADILQLSLDKVRAVVARIDDEAIWEKGLPGIDSFHFDAGPSLAGADAGLLRFAPGAAFPRHRHVVGREVTFVLEGDLVEGGVTYGPGSVVVRELGSVHSCAATPGRGLTTLVVHYGIEPVFSD
jgi:anti-sigma factor RsiW